MKFVTLYILKTQQFLADAEVIKMITVFTE